MRTLTDMKDVTDTVMIATHDMQLVCEWAERIIVLCQGNVVADGIAGCNLRQRICRKEGRYPAAGDLPMGQALDERAFCYTVDEFFTVVFGRRNFFLMTGIIESPVRQYMGTGKAI